MAIRFALALALLATTAFAADIPPELSAARAEYEARLAIPRGKLDAAIHARGLKYAADLLALETRVAAAGQLDALLSVKTEREAYEAGKQTNGYPVGDTKIPVAARQVRAAFDSDVKRMRGAMTPESRALAANYVKQLSDLERRLTTARDVAGALAVRQEREETQTGGMDPLSTTSGLLGAWQPSNKDRNNVLRGTSVTFGRDGKWRNSREDTGTWLWADKGKRKIEIRWDKKDWHDEYTLSPDGKRLEGHDNQGDPLFMERFP